MRVDLAPTCSVPQLAAAQQRCCSLSTLPWPTLAVDRDLTALTCRATSESESGKPSEPRPHGIPHSAHSSYSNHYLMEILWQIIYNVLQLLLAVVVWLNGNIIGLDQRFCSTLGLVCTGMSNCQQASRSSQSVTSSTQPGHPSVCRHNEYYQKPVSKQAHHVMH